MSGEVLDHYYTWSVWPTFELVKPTINNTRVNISPYGHSVFSGVIDATSAVHKCYFQVPGSIWGNAHEDHTFIHLYTVLDR